MRSVGHYPTKRELKKIMQDIDIDGNGIVDLNDFLLLIAK